MTNLQIIEFLKNGAFFRKNMKTLVIFAPYLPLGESVATAKDFFNSSEEAWIKVKFGSVECSIEEFVTQLNKLDLVVTPELERQHFSEPQKKDFEKAFRDCQQKIHRGEIEKSVPISQVHANADVSISQIRSWLFKLLKAPQSLVPYGIWCDGRGVIGASPELLFERSGTFVKTMALAGTCPKSEMHERSPLMKDSKELHEHFLVIKDIRDQLSRFGPVLVSPTEVVELPRLFHLKTEISVQSEAENETLIKVLHPTPALGVFPRNYGLNWLKTQPYQEERGVFGGPISFIESETEATAVVGIRNLIWSAKKVYLMVGCGVVKNSQLDREWNELNEKRNSVFDIFGMKA